MGMGCTTEPRPAAKASAAPRASVGHVLVAVTADGAVLLDRKSNTYVGVGRDGRRVWTDPDAFARGASVVCVGVCPDAVVSGAVPRMPSEPAPVLYAAAARAPFTVPVARYRTVLTARSATDAVVAETDAQGKSWLHVLRPDGEQRLPLATPDAGWYENPDATAAVLLPHGSSGAATVRWFVRDTAGWRATGNEFQASQLRDACVVRDGRTALLAGPEPVLVLDRTSTVPVRTDLPVVSECSIGERGGVVLARSFTTVGFRTDVRGIGLDGATTWSRRYDSEAMVSTDPAGERTAVAHDGVLDILDRTGQIVEAGLASKASDSPPRDGSSSSHRTARSAGFHDQSHPSVRSSPTGRGRHTASGPASSRLRPGRPGRSATGRRSPTGPRWRVGAGRPATGRPCPAGTRPGGGSGSNRPL